MLVRHPAFWMGFLGMALILQFLWGCDIPTSYDVNGPDCPWPPPRVTDVEVTLLPLGCPWTDQNGVVVNGWPRL